MEHLDAHGDAITLDRIVEYDDPTPDHLGERVVGEVHALLPDGKVAVGYTDGSLLHVESHLLVCAGRIETVTFIDRGEGQPGLII